MSINYNKRSRFLSGNKWCINMFLFITFLLIIPSACEKEDDVATRDYPRLITLGVSEISQTGAKFNAEIISGNPAEIIGYGFTWSDIVDSPKLENNANIDITGSVSDNKFSADVQTLESNKVYYLRSFIKTNDLLIYGRVVSFKTL